MKYLFFLLTLAGIFLLDSCKTKPASSTTNTPVDPSVMEKMWKTVDSLEKKGLTSSALEEVKKIKQFAITGKESGHLIKAITHENKYLVQLEEDSALKALFRAEAEMDSYPEPAKSVMHSLAAQWYGTYLQSHLWELRNRTEYGGPAGPDIRTWGIRHFIDKIQEHYTQSVQWDGLRTAGVKDYLLLLTDEKNTDELRPTLYDILMHRALDFYAGTESFLTAPAYGFVLTDPLAFAQARSFIGHSFPSQDSLSSTWQALRWFQHLLAFRLNDSEHGAALLDADLKRLRFVYDHIVIDGKDSIYQRALDELSSRHTNNPESSLVDYYRAELLIQQAGQWPGDTTSPHRYAYNTALEICNKAIEQFPDAYGSQLCKTLINQIEQKSISASVESINLPGEELLAKLDYRNLPAVYLKIVKLPESPRRYRGELWDGEEVLRRLNQLAPVKSWKQDLDSGKDHQPHATEIALPELPLGHYALVVSDKDNFDVKSSTSGTIMFTISELAYWMLDDRGQEQVAAIINRRTGLPIQGVKTEFITYEYNANLRKQEEIKLGEGLSDANGWVTVPKRENRNISLRLTKGADELFLDDSYYIYRQGGKTNTNSTTLFFSDRSIYRPGQKMYFKGYALEFDPDQIPSIVGNKNVELVLYDANGQEVAKQSLRSNTYGTFSGHFDLPSGGLTGRMSIQSSHGPNRMYFQVEEYKRPKFEVTFDTLKGIARLNEEVTVRGNALDYAGSPVAGAQTGYRVERVTYRPWWYGYYKGFWPSQQDRQVLTVGQSFTKEDGSVDITFLAKGKAGADPDLMYRFEITLFVTDITGESHEATKSIALNQQGYEVSIQLAERNSLDALKEINITSQNSDGADVKVDGEVEVSSITGPVQNKRARLWPSPDMMTLKESDYTSRFASYYVPGKEQMSAWAVNKTLGKKSISVTGSGKVDLSSLIVIPGYYKLNWTWKDASGKTLNITQYVMTYGPSLLLPGHEVAEVDIRDQNYEPGDVVSFEVLTGIANPPKAIRIVERRTVPPVRNWMSLPTYNDRSVTLTEADRGDVYVHHLTAYNNRFYEDHQLIRVPWTNKDLSVALKTWRDKMEPGDEETWTLTVEGQKKEKVMAELLLSMYDASLDAFIPHQWHMSLYPSTLTRMVIHNAQPQPVQYWGLTYHWDQNIQDVPWRQYRDINTYGYYPEGGYYPRSRGGRVYKGEEGAVMMQANEAAPAGVPPADMDLSMAAGEKKTESLQTGAEQKAAPQSAPPLRSVLDETAFFYPQMNTDDQGRLTFSFKMKEGLTRWKFQALAHTKDLAFGLTQAEAVTQKQLMVFPNPPRFFREGDTISFQVKVTNLTDKIQSGKVLLKIVDAFTDEDVSAAWKIAPVEQQLQINSKGTSPASWTLQVPSGWNRPVKYQVSAAAGSFSDGEESILPVVTNRVLITETLPLPIKANETRTFVFKSMMENRSATATDHRYVVEMTTSPAWYAVQALPYLMEYPHECAEQIYSRLYANALATHIANKYPAIKQVYDGWRVTGDDALISNLEKNKELKSALLDETPWVRDAMGETQQKKNIALLFETNRLRNESQQALDRLRQMQLSNGGFPWFPGGRDNWYITQYIVEGFGHLEKMGVKFPQGDAMDMVQRAVPYIDSRIIEWYDELKKQEAAGKLKMSDHHIGAMQVHYLYTRSFFPTIDHTAKLDEITSYMRSQIEKYWLEHGIYEQGLMALGSFRTWPNAVISKEILASLRERTILHEELGRYWKFTSGFQWNEAPVELQSLMIELYQDMGVPQAEVDELRVWLLKQKQTTQWKSTKATASAIYALLIHPDTWLQSVGIVEVKLGKEEVIGKSTSVEAGTGYVKKSWDGKEIKKDWSAITVSNPNKHIAWGGVYWQYWEDIDKVKSTVENNPLKVNRSLLRVKDGDRGEQTNMAPSRNLRVGDKLIVRLTIETDRAMEFVHLKDLRASGFEPMDVISGYRWVGGLGYYQSTRDLATHFFIDYLPRGKFVIEYPVTVAQAGSYSEGLATLQCMYAPEFGSHSEGSRVSAQKN
jgi:Bacterial Alpha-2-macroglobulin MG10 domain/Alpha-2-macroglobulin family/MG2 domain